MSAISVTISGDTPAEVGARLRVLADALTSTAPAPAPAAKVQPGSGLPEVPSTPAPKLCAVHHAPLRFDEWDARSGKRCRAWRCPQATPDTGCTIEWAS